MKWLKINHDDAKSTFEYVELPEDLSLWLDGVYRELSCESIEVVSTSFHPWVLVIDECGKLKDDWLSRLNTVASILYGSWIDCIVGDCLLCHRVGADLVPLSEDECQALFRRFGNVR